MFVFVCSVCLILDLGLVWKTKSLDALTTLHSYGGFHWRKQSLKIVYLQNSPRMYTVANKIRSISAIFFAKWLSSVLLRLNGTPACRQQCTLCGETELNNRWLVFYLGQPLLGYRKGSWKDWVINCMIVFINVSMCNTTWFPVQKRGVPDSVTKRNKLNKEKITPFRRFTKIYHLALWRSR